MPKILIDMGQSNQSGRGDMSTMSAQYKTVLSNVQMWTGSQFDSMDYSINNNQFPVSSQSNQGGSEFVRSVALANYFGETVYRISYAVGSTGLTNSFPAGTSWNTSYTGGLLELLKRTVYNAIIYMWNTLNVRGPIDLYIFWCQGEADTAALAWQQAYETNIVNLINKVREFFSGTSIRKSVFIISRTNTLINNGTGTDTVVTAATNTTPIEITTQGSNTGATGRAVRITGVLGNTAANGTWTVTNVSGTKYTLDTSVGNGVRTGGGYVNYLPYAVEIAASQQSGVALVTNAYSLSTDAYALQSDGAHFTMAGYEAKGQAEANIIINNNL